MKNKENTYSSQITMNVLPPTGLGALTGEKNLRFYNKLYTYSTSPVGLFLWLITIHVFIPNNYY